jgi:outer membrane protein assembly factor BamB
MPLQLDDLSALSYADGFTLWHYQSAADSRSTMSAPGYFAPVSHMVRAGDIILARGSDGFVLLHMAGTGTNLTATAF